MIKDKIEHHRVFILSYNFIEYLDSKANLEENKNDDTTENNTYLINRAEITARHLNSKLISIDPILLTINLLDELENHLSSLIRIYKKETMSQNDWTSLDSCTNSILNSLIKIPMVINNEQIGDLRKAATAFRRSLGQQRSNIDNEFLTFLNQRNDALEEVEDLNKTVHLLNDFIKKVEEEIKNNTDSELLNLKKEIKDIHQKAISEQEKRSLDFINQIDDLNTDFEDLLTELRDQIDEETSHIIEEVNEKRNSYNKEMEKHLDDYRNGSANFFEELNKNQDHVEKMVGALATNSISGHYKKVATRHWRATVTWQTLTVLSLLGTVAAGWYGLFFLETDTWYQFAGKILVTGALGSLAAYTARQAKHNIISEQRNRKLEVELKTLNPFMANFEDELQIELKKQLFPLIFGRDVELNKSNKETRNSKSNESNVS